MLLVQLHHSLCLHKHQNFNTLYVVGSIDELFPLNHILLFQYIICCWFKFSLLLRASLNPISIHYMLLVQITQDGNDVLVSKFQYIICCWFKVVVNLQMLVYWHFNALYVVGSSKLWRLSYSLKHISIHYMLLVQNVKQTYSLYFHLISIHYMLLVQCDKMF